MLLCITLATLFVGWSRFYLHEHSSIQITAGISLGIACGFTWCFIEHIIAPLLNPLLIRIASFFGFNLYYLNLNFLECTQENSY